LSGFTGLVGGSTRRDQRRLGHVHVGGAQVAAAKTGDNFFSRISQRKKNILSKFRRKNFYAVLENRTFFSGTFFTIIAF
jgi:hypothetical protein